MQNENQQIRNKDGLLSIGDAADFLGVSVDTLRRWEKKGKIEAYRSPGGHRYFKKEDLSDLFGTKYERVSEGFSSRKEVITSQAGPSLSGEAEEKEEKKVGHSRGGASKEEKRLNIPDITPISVKKQEITPEPSRGVSNKGFSSSSLTREQHARITEILAYSTQQSESSAASKKGQKGFGWGIVIGLILFVIFLVDAILFYLWYTSGSVVSPVP
jgi:excisionase family DNA binding protein